MAATPFDEERLATLPRLPGIYLMKDRDGKVIYVGKAKDLRSRVRSYFRGGDGRPAVPFLVRRISAVEIIVTEDESQALILEADLIKRFKPSYNIRLKDDKAHLIVRIDEEAEWPRVEVVRRLEEDGATYIGPFTFGYELHTLLDVVREAVPLRTCTDKVFHNRVRPCLEYQLRRCAGPCCLEVDRAQYAAWVKTAVSILQRKNADVLSRLEHDMERASADLRFEEAAEIRDRIEVIRKAAEERQQYFFSAGSKDAFGLHREGQRLELTVLMVRNGRLFSARSFGFEGVEFPSEELLGSLVTQFYGTAQEIPEEILLPLELDDGEAREEFYAKRRGAKVSIVTPKRGDRLKLLALAQANARENFVGRFGQAAEDSVLKLLQNELGLDEAPRVIECVDISHFQGGSSVAAVVFFKDGRPDKSRYRLFHVSQEGKPDDFASMREVVMRHLSRCAEENSVSDLMMIDGGPGQLAQALEVRRELGLQQPVMIALAKRRVLRKPPLALASTTFYKPERIYREGRRDAIVLREGSKALHLLERIRDEAHRFAIRFHRRTRAKKLFTSVLDDVPGLGERRRRELLRAFGSVEEIRRAEAEAICAVAGIPRKVAERVIERLRKRKEDQ